MLQFSKYHGTGNDFILVDNRQMHFKKSKEYIALLCHRRFGIGADGLILLESTDQSGFDFKMVYYNADGVVGSMCGNGGRCVVAFAKSLGILSDHARFLATDGEHIASIEEGLIHLKMTDVDEFEQLGDDYVIDTGSPHYIRFVDNPSALDVAKEGRLIRNSPRFKAKGINVNFVDPHTTPFQIRTYERGVEAETYSCGTGVTATALALSLAEKTTATKIDLKTLGGLLSVQFQKDHGGFNDIWLSGPAQQVFTGTLPAFNKSIKR